MQCLKTFEKVCAFFIQSTLDKSYIEKIDRELLKNSKKETVLLVKNVKAFHSMRKSLCLKIFTHIGNSPILTQLADSRGIIQYKKCPENSTCAISKVKLKQSHGILLVIDGSHLMTIHSRYKIILYHFWTLVHMPEEIGLEAMKWLTRQHWWRGGIGCNHTVCTERILQYDDHVFAKTMYVKLKSVAEFIEKDLVKIPIQK